jgi:putative proteasome-type protease
MDSTLKSNISVGVPLDMVVYEKDSLQATKIVTLDEDNPYFAMIHSSWGEKLREAFNSIPEPNWHGGKKSNVISVPAKKIGAIPIHKQSSKVSKPSKSSLKVNPKISAKKVATKKKA